MATAEATRQREEEQREREDRVKKEREQREEQEKKDREEGKRRANERAEKLMEKKAEPPDAATVYESIRQLTIIAENQHNDANLALVSLAKAVLGLLPYIILETEPIHHLHGRNIVPGKKIDVPIRTGPEPKGETPSTQPEVYREQRKQEYEGGLQSMRDQSARDREIAEANDPSKPSRPEGEQLPAEDRPGTRPGDRPAPGEGRPHPDQDLPGREGEPKHEPNPPARRASDRDS